MHPYWKKLLEDWLTQEKKLIPKKKTIDSKKMWNSFRNKMGLGGIPQWQLYNRSRSQWDQIRRYSLQENIFKKVGFIQQVMIQRLDDLSNAVNKFILLSKKKKELELKALCKLKICMKNHNLNMKQTKES